MPCTQILKQYFAVYNRICNQAGYSGRLKWARNHEFTVRGNSFLSGETRILWKGLINLFEGLLLIKPF